MIAHPNDDKRVFFLCVCVLSPRQVFIHCSDEGMGAELESLLGDETLKRKSERSNGVDDLRFVLLVSKVRDMLFFLMGRENGGGGGYLFICFLCVSGAAFVWRRTAVEQESTSVNGVAYGVLGGRVLCTAVGAFRCAFRDWLYCCRAR